MALYSAEGVTTVTASAASVLGVKAGAADIKLFELFLGLAAATATRVRLARATAVGTSSATVTPVTEDFGVAGAALARVETAWSAQPTAASVGFRRGSGPAAIGNGIIWQFPEGLYIPASGSVLVVNTAGAVISTLDFHAIIRE